MKKIKSPLAFLLVSVVLVGTGAGGQVKITDKTIQTIIKGLDVPYTDPAGVPNDWYGRTMMTIVDQNRWIMALRSGVDHVETDKGDTIHLVTSTDEGRTWSALNRWFDGTPITGMPRYDYNCHSEPGLYKMPNGDLILQSWNSYVSAGTQQMRSTDNGKTWVVDSSRISVTGVPGHAGNKVLGTENCFVDPEHPTDVYMGFEYVDDGGFDGSLLAKSQDNGLSYQFVSWLAPTTIPNFEPAIEYVGNRTIVAVMRDSNNKCTWQSKSTDMGLTFSTPVDISAQINGGVSGGLWQRARLYKESNPYFQYDNQLDYAAGEGVLWGFGIHSNDGNWSRKPAVWWSLDNGTTWCGPELLHGPMYPGTDTGYGDTRRRADGTFVANTYYGNQASTYADLEQYTFRVIPESGSFTLLALGGLTWSCWSVACWIRRRRSTDVLAEHDIT